MSPHSGIAMVSEHGPRVGHCKPSPLRGDLRQGAFRSLLCAVRLSTVTQLSVATRDLARQAQMLNFQAGE